MSCKEHGFNLKCIPEPLFWYRIRPDSKLHMDQSNLNTQNLKIQLLRAKHPNFGG
jgi:hypothetical protein